MTTLTFDQICRRAGGRRRYNLQRQTAAERRLEQVKELLARYVHKGLGVEVRLARGVQAQIARELGVSEATISRDVTEIKLLTAIEQLIEKTFPIDFSSDDADYDWSESLNSDWSVETTLEMFSAEAKHKRKRAAGQVPDRRGGRRAGAGRKRKSRGVDLDAALRDLLGPYPTERQLNVVCKKMIEHALRGNIDAIRVVMAWSEG